MFEFLSALFAADVIFTTLTVIGGIIEHIEEAGEHSCDSACVLTPYTLGDDIIDTIKKYFWKPYVRMSLPQLDFHKKGGNNSSKPSCKVGSSKIEIRPDNCLTIPCLHKHFKILCINGGLFSLYQSKDWADLFKNAGKYDFCNHCTIDCYFGMTYKDRILRYPIKQNITSLKNFLESKRSKK